MSWQEDLKPTNDPLAIGKQVIEFITQTDYAVITIHKSEDNDDWYITGSYN